MQSRTSAHRYSVKMGPDRPQQQPRSSTAERFTDPLPFIDALERLKAQQQRERDGA